jgi:hypothetical protein
MNDREELRRLIDMIEKASGTGSVEQVAGDIKIFANTASFLANKLDTRLTSGKVKAKKKPKSRMGGAIASMPIPKPRVSKSPTISVACRERLPSQQVRLTLIVLSHKAVKAQLRLLKHMGGCACKRFVAW